MHDDIAPTSLGLFRCLQALAEETAALGLTRTYSALQMTIDACRQEADLTVTLNGLGLQAHLLH